MPAIKYVIAKDTSSSIKGYQWLDIDPTLSIVNTNADVNSIKDIEAIRSSINNLFRFNKGERLINPDYGTLIRTLLYESITTVLERGPALILAELNKWEPRIKIVSIDIKEVVEYQNTILITIEYTVPSLPNMNKQSIQMEIS